MKGLISICLLGIMLAGCAFGDRQAKLDYPPSEDPGLVTSAQASPASGTRGVVYLEDFRDLRPDKHTVGHVQNGFGMKTADVFGVGSVSKWVRKAVAHELKAAGFRVKGRGSAPDDAITISGDILYVYTKAFFTYEGEVQLQVVVKQAGRYLLDRRYTGTGSAGLNVAATGDSYAESLAVALKASLEKVLSDLDSLGI